MVNKEFLRVIVTVALVLFLLILMSGAFYSIYSSKDESSPPYNIFKERPTLNKIMKVLSTIIDIFIFW